MAIKRILMAHNHYRWLGGEDAVVAEETRILRTAGIEVIEHLADNSEILKQGKLATARALWRSAWSRPAYRAMRQRLDESCPELVHVHNLWFALTPSILAACREKKVPVVMTLHNFRLFCAAGVLQDRSGSACMDCLDQGVWTGAWRRCYHGGFIPSLAVTRMQAYNRRRGTWLKNVDRFIVPSGFCRDLFVRFGLPQEKIIVKSHSVRDPLADAARTPDLPMPLRVLFIGRLSLEKGLATLIKAWREVEPKFKAELRIVGDGPLRGELVKETNGMHVSFAGEVPEASIPAEIRAATLVVLPSECYETYGRVVVEAWSGGRPVVVSNRGGPAELVKDSGAGLIFDAGSHSDLAEKLSSLLSDQQLCASLGAKGREGYLKTYTPESNLEMLLKIYAETIDAGR